ncbi:MAG: XVIPCD domain-containing protein, partial [Lysobacter sp.]
GRLDAALKIQEMTLRFGNSTYKDEAGNSVVVSQEMVGNLLTAINASPVLADRITAAIDAEPKPHLKNFGILPHGQGAGAAYDGNDKTMLIPANRLQNKSPTNTSGFDVAPMVFTLAHETQHGFNHENKRQAWGAFDGELKRIARDNNPINDYTPPIEKFLLASRQDEARAEIAGWNAVVSMKGQSDPQVDLEDMKRIGGIRSYVFLQRDDATQQLVGKSGLSFNADSTLEPTPNNIEAMGKNYFDRSPKGDGIESAQTANLGPYGEADYPNYYGKNAIERVIVFDREYARSVGGVEPQMHINMGQLRLSERLIERLGLEIDPNPERPQPYYDTGQSPPALHHFEHTRTGPNRNQHIPIDLESPPDTFAQTPTKLSPSQSGHSDHPLYSQIADRVREQDQHHGRQWDETSERMTASLLALAKEGGLSRVDHVVFSAKTDRTAAGENVFVVQG